MQRVATPSGRIGWTLTYGDGKPVEPVERFLRHRFYAEASPNTLKAYAHDLKLFFAFAAEQIRAGLSKAYVYERRFAQYSRFKSVERTARQRDRGVWGSCGGDFHSAQ